MNFDPKMGRGELRKRARANLPKPRVPFAKSDLEQLFTLYSTDSPAELAKRSGLPYLLVYNVVYGRVQTVSKRHYEILFGKPAPRQAPMKVDGTLFRAMADLWLFLNGGTTQADLYRELLDCGPHTAVDHRIFNGRVKTVSAKLEHAIRQKFSDVGIDQPLLERWLDEFAELDQENWVPYRKVQPMLAYLERNLGVHPTAVLRQSVVRYETGELKRVSRTTCERIQRLKQSTQKALKQGGQPHGDKLRETLLGGKSGYTLFSEIEAELLFLCRHNRKGAKYYLGRSLWTYQNRKTKRIADWRARKIIQDCGQYIRAHPALTLADLPESFRRAQIQGLVGVVMARGSQLLSEKEGLDFEKNILRPNRTRDDYENSYQGLIPFDTASHVLGMKRLAFDLMVASHCDIFRSVGKRSERWYLPGMYLKELRGKIGFSLISAKYEKLAGELLLRDEIGTCMK